MLKIIITNIESSLLDYRINEDSTNLNCKAWELSDHVNNEVGEILCNQSFAYLTTMEADATLLDWFKVLGVKGALRLTLPDANYWAQQWIEAEWNEQTLRDETSIARSSFAGVFGPQKTGNPKFSNYSETYSEVFKSGYNEKRLRFLLERVGFGEIHIKSSKGILEACAVKTLQIGERQIASSFENIRLDHKNRYQFACEQLRNKKITSILDLACGIGYGSLMLAKTTNAKVTGVDIDKGAIEYANKFFSNHNTDFICEDARKLSLEKNSFDAIISFETIEHVEFDTELLATFYELLKPGGIFICSTPNEDVMPFSKENFKFHVRHYKVDEIRLILETAKFEVKQSFTQLDAKVGQVISGDHGCFSVFLCSK
jgi:SAM-dependent methyltransferase